MRKLISLLVLLLTASTALASTDYWTWVDQNGVTNYAETRPDGVTNAKHIVASQAFGQRVADDNDDASQSADDTAAADPANDAGNGESGTIDPDKAAAKDRAAIKAKIAKIKKSNCSLGKHNLAQLQSYPEIRVKGKDGKDHILSQQERQEKIEQARQIIRDNCSA